MPRIAQLVNRLQSERGLGLVETLVAVAILGTSVVAFVVALSAGSLAVGEQNTETVSQSLAQTQMEYTKDYSFDPDAITYPTIAAPASYNISVAVSSVAGTDTNMQKITVTILKDSLIQYLLSDYKVNR